MIFFKKERWDVLIFFMVELPTFNRSWRGAGQKKPKLRNTDVIEELRATYRRRTEFSSSQARFKVCSPCTFRYLFFILLLEVYSNIVPYPFRNYLENYRNASKN